MTSTSTGIFIAHDTLNMLPPKLRADLLDALFDSTSLGPTKAIGFPPEGPLASPSPGEVVADQPSRGDDEDIVDLTPALARRLIRGCSKKTTTALTVMVSNPTNEFKVAAVSKALSVPAGELSGVWAGITRRTRTVMGKDKLFLIRWLRDEVLDAEGKYIDQTGTFSEMTYRSLRKALLDD